MIRLDRIARLSASPEDAFSFFAEFENIPQWDPGTVGCVKRGSAATDIGTVYDVTVSIRGFESTMRYEVTRWDPNELVELRGKGGVVTGVDRISFSPLPNGGTKVRYVAEFTLPTWLRPFESLMRPAFERIGDKAMAGMAAARVPSVHAAV